MKNIAFRTLAVFALGAIAACSKPPARQHAATQQAVATSVARDMTVAPSATLAGTIAPYQNVAIQTSLNEPTSVVNVNEGDIVHRGEVLAVLNTDDLQANLRADLASAQSNGAKVSQTTYQARETITQGSQQVRSAQSALSQAQHTLSNDATNLARYKQLFGNGYVPEQQVVQQQTLVANDQQAVRSAQSSLTSAIAAEQANGTMQNGMQASIVSGTRADQSMALAQADQIRAQIARATIVSPIDGIVVNRNLNPGEYPGTRQIFTLQQVDPVYAIFSASGAQIVGIHNGANVALMPVDEPGQTYNATVVGVLDQVQPGSTNFVVKALLRNPKHTLKSGMVVSGRVALQPVHGIGVPVTAFLDDSRSTVMVVRSDGTVHETPVHQVGGSSQTAIVTGISAGTTVVSNGQLGLVEGQKVALR
jgi:HlyD family secretion protein